MNHLTEVSGSGLHGALGDDEGSLLLVTLETNTHVHIHCYSYASCSEIWKLKGALRFLHEQHWHECSLDFLPPVPHAICQLNGTTMTIILVAPK